MADFGVWVMTSVVLAAGLSLIVAGAMIYSVLEIVHERLAFWERMRSRD